MVVQMDQLRYRYRRTNPVWVLDGIDLAIEAGSYVFVCGASGSGKSTLARTFNGLIPHFYGGIFEGYVVVANEDTRSCNVGDLCALVGMVFQNPNAQLFTGTVEREIVFGLESLGVPQSQMRRRVEETANLVGIASLLPRNPRNLSGGEQQLVAIAAALAMHPHVLVLDEPYANLDPANVQRVRGVLRNVNQHGTTIVLTEHRLQHAIADVDRMVVVQGGQIVCDGPPRQVLQQDRAIRALNVPPVVRLAKEYGLPTVPLTVDELLDGADEKTLQDMRYGQLCATRHQREKVQTMSASQNIISLQQVSFKVGATWALRDVSLDVYVGECLALVGANGAGKTTLIKHLNGLYRPHQGHVTVDGKPTRRSAVSQLARTVGIAFQNPNSQFFKFRVWDEIVAGPQAMGCYDEAWVGEIVRLFRLEPLLESSPYKLSEGEKKRVAFAAALAARPAVLVLDEPTAGQDWHFRQTLGDLFAQLRTRGQTVVLVTHDLEFAEQYADRWVLLSAGHVLKSGRPWEVMADAVAMQEAGLEPTDMFQITQTLFTIFTTAVGS